MYKEDLVLNNLQWLRCHKTPIQPNQANLVCLTILLVVVVGKEKRCIRAFPKGISMK